MWVDNDDDDGGKRADAETPAAVEIGKEVGRTTPAARACDDDTGFALVGTPKEEDESGGNIFIRLS